MKVIIADKYPDKLKNELDKLADIVYKPEITKDELKKEIKDADILIVRSRTKIDKDVINCSGRLRYAITGTHGIDHVDYECLNKKGIKFDNVAEQDISVAEHVFALLLNLAKDVTLTDTAIKKGADLKSKVMGVELNNKTIGIIGYGKIGKKVAEISKGFGMKVLSYDANKSAFDKNSVAVGIEELLKKSDVITVHIPFNSNTYHFINEEKINKMKNGSYFINTDRGGIVDEKALYKAVIGGKIAKVGLDVSEYPFDINNPWLKLSDEKAVITPHIAGQTAESRERTIDKIIKNVAEFINSEKNGC